MKKRTPPHPAERLFTPTVTLEAARGLLKKLAIDGGAYCPCCGQFTKVYQRQIHSSQVRTLITMYHNRGLAWQYLPDVHQHSRDFTHVAYWGLIEEKGVPRQDGGRRGLWRVTDLGEDWLRGRVKVPKYALIYDAKFLGYQGDQVSADEALGKDFKLDELMNTPTLG